MNFRFVTNILFPRSCLSCGGALRDGVLCAPCGRIITLAPAIFGLASPCPRGSATHYENPAVKSLIHALKFRYIKDAAIDLGRILAAGLAALPLDFTDYALTPVPLSKKRERLRGFNQAALIARECARISGLPYRDGIITRTAHRKPQSETADLAERAQNIKGCFAPAPASGPLSESPPSSVILVDDVTTSGATFAEAAVALRNAGVQKIIAIAVARA